jgi:hypothetical protein
LLGRSSNPHLEIRSRTRLSKEREGNNMCCIQWQCVSLIS